MAEKEIRKAELGDEDLNEVAGGVRLGTTANNDQKDGLFLVIFQPGAQYIIFAK